MKTSTNIQLNPLKIVWAISISQDGKPLYQHFASKERLEELFVPKFGTKVYIITDKQFGMIQNSYDKTVHTLPEPFTHSLLIDYKGVKSLIPLSENQFNAAIQY